MSDTVPQPMRILKPSPATTTPTPANGEGENVERKVPSAEADVSAALEGLSLDTGKEASKGDDSTAQEKPVSGAPEKQDEAIETKSDEPLAADKSEPASQKSSSAVSETSDDPASSTTTGTSGEPQLINGIPAQPVDHPDPRLIGALENPRDRLFVIKLEKTVLEFIAEESESIDLPPTNSYHRLLTHKLAEYYRLTHLADAANTSVRIFRGQSARIPPTKLSNWPVPLLQQQQKPSAGAAPAVRIMRRSPPSDGKGTSSQKKDGSEASSENESSSACAAKSSREEREAAYQQARARIFKDFVESPPETPPPASEKKAKRRDHNDDEFSSRSAFFAMTHPLPPQMYYPQQQQFADPSSYNMMPQAGPMSAMPYNSMMPSFSPSAPAYSPGANNSYPMSPQRQPYPNPAHPYSTPDRSSFPQSQPQQSLYPQQYPLHGQASPQPLRQTPGYGYPGQQHPPTTPNNSYSQPLRPPMMQSSYSSSGTPGYHSQNLTPPHAPMSAPPPQMNRQQFPPLPGQVNSFQSQQRGQHQGPNGYGAWPQANQIGGAPMNPRSSSAPGMRPGEMGGYQQGWGQQNGAGGAGAWNAAAAARGNMGGMNGMHHGTLGPMHGMKANSMGMGAGGMNGMRM